MLLNPKKEKYMSREKSKLTQDTVSMLGKIVNAITSENVTEDLIRTSCRMAGIAAPGQGDLSVYLKEFRRTVPAPKDKLAVLADILPEGFLLALLLIAQEFIQAQVTKVYQADTEAIMSLQSKLALLENKYAEALTAITTKEAEYASLATELDSAQKIVSNLTDCLTAAEKENLLLSGRLLEREEANKKKANGKEPMVRAFKVPAAVDNLPQKMPEESQSNDSIAELPAVAGGN